MSRKLITALCAVGFIAALCLVPPAVHSLFAADTTFSQFNVQQQAYQLLRLKDNTDGSFGQCHWQTGDGTHFQPSGDAPARSVYNVPALPGTFVVGTSTGAAQANSPTMPAVSAKTNYCAGFTVTGGGATAGSAITITLSDGTKTLNFMTNIPAGVSTPLTPMVIAFPEPIPASASNTAWTLTVPSFGSGNTAASANIWGYVN